jgi:peroxin-19
MADVDLDLILDQALDDFEEQELEENTEKALQGDKNEEEDEEAKKMEEAERMRQLMEGMNDPRFGDTLQSTLRSLSKTNEGNQNVEDLFNSINERFDMSEQQQTKFMPDGPEDTEGIKNADREVATTLQMLANAQKGMQGFGAAKMEETGETMMEDMMSQFQSLGDKEDYHDVVDGVMRQLLSKDLMYEPVKQICEKFPEWLAMHKKNLTQNEYEAYGKQYQTFQKLLATYDIEPDNFERMMELMFDMQHYGQPPAEIIKDLAPGLKFDENGMPIMPNMGAGMMPDMPGGEGLPNLAELAGQMGSGQCSLM